MSSMASTQSLDRKATDEVAAPAVAAPAKKNKARPYLILGALVGLALAIYGGITWYSRGKENTDDAQVDADIVTVSTRVSGPVLKVYVHSNQQVTKGQPLVDIDPADYAARAKQAEAELAAAQAQARAADAQVGIVEATSKGGLSVARAQLSGSATSVAGADADVAAAQAALARSQAQADQADTDLARAESLLKDQAIPRAQVDTARSNAQAAHAAVAQAQAQIAAAKDMKRTAQTRIAESAARVEQSAPVDAQLASARAQADLAHAREQSAEAALALAKLQLSYTHITAPTDGMLSRLAVQEGQLVQAGQQVISVVPNTTYVTANFKETQVGQMRVGQRAEIKVDAYPGRTFEGKVNSTSPGTGARFSLLPPDNASGNFVKVVQRVPVTITWVNVPADVKLSAGMSTDVTVITR
ncbi:MAG TPA: HlyD family secretion protein [Polyangiaceae bacterium]|jgi:membrane fusion protein (multidrug efflux system)